MNKRINYLHLVFVLLFSSQIVSANVVQNYKYPIKDPFLATATTAAISLLVDQSQFDLPWPSRIFARPINVQLNFADFPERENTPFFEKRHTYQTNFVYHKGQKRPLVVVLGGLGASSNGGVNKFLYHMLHKAGFHVLSLGSPFFWQYNLGFVQDATPGILERESKDLYLLAKRSIDRLKKDYDFEISENLLLGYSLGALESVFMAQLDESEKIFDFQKVIAINPPLSLITSARRLDQYYKTWQGLGAKKQSILESKKWNLIFKFSDSPNDIDIRDLLRVLSQGFISSIEAEALLGEKFRESLATTLFISELVNRRGLFDTFIGHYSPQPGLDNARKFTFLKYLKDVLLPYYQSLEPGITFEQMEFKLSLKSKASFMKNNSNLYVLHNLDDPIMSKEEIYQLEEIVGKERMTLFPYGGHMGNIWFQDNIKRIIEILKS